MPFISFDVEILWVKKFDTMLLHPRTRLSKIRKILEQDVPEDISLDEFWFTYDGMGRLKEWRSLWDLGVISGSTLYMRSSCLPLSHRVLLISSFSGTFAISFTVQIGGSTMVVDAQEDDTIQDFKERCALIAEIPLTTQRMVHRGKILQDGNTLKQEGLVGGEKLICESTRL